MTETGRPLGAARIIGYGFGDFGFNLFYTGLNIFLLYYYTDVLMIAPALAGLIFMAAVIWDAVTDPLMGWIATRTRSRFGRYRPYLLFATPLMALGFVGMFAAPVLFPSAVVVSSILAHLLFRTIYTVVNVPYTALSAAMTQSAQTRSYLSGARMFFAIIGALLTAVLTLSLATTLGGDDVRRGFIYVSALYAAIATLTSFVAFAASREDADVMAAAPSPTTAETLKFLRHNRAFWILALAIFMSTIGASIGNKTIVYYVTYYMGAPASAGVVFATVLLVAALSVPLWTWASSRWSKRNIWITGAAGLIAMQIALYAVAPTSVSMMIMLVAFMGLFLGVTAIIMWSMAPDTVEYGEWASGVRDEAIVFGLVQLALKFGSGAGVGLLGFLLAGIGYVAGEPQTAETLQGLRGLAFLVPLMGALLGVCVIWFYPVDANRHAEMKEDIAVRRGSAQAAI